MLSIQLFYFDIQSVLQKLTNQKVNDLDELKSIYSLLVKALQSFYPGFTSLHRPDLSGAQGYFQNPTASFSFDTLRNIPSLVSFKFSPWNYLRHERLPSIADAIYDYRPYAFNPIHFLPPFEKHAQLIDGHHAFSFAGSHFTFSGASSCNYVLAQDIVNHNFTIVANLGATGRLESITLFDKANTVELKADTGMVLLNDEKAALPLHHGDINAWRDYHTVSLLTTYGARVQCSIDLRVCSVTVNGFYHGKLRGLFGAANSEPSHDLKTLDGKTALDSAALGKAFALGTNCPAGNPHDASVHTASAPKCVKYFADDTSKLFFGFLFIRPHKYREACEHAVAEATTPADKDAAACVVARGYVLAARTQHIWVDLPDECIKCNGEHSVFESFKAVAPQQKADIVVVVDTATKNIADLVNPVLTQLRADLKARDITDSHIIVLGYNKHRIYTRLFTNGATGSTDHSADMKITDGGPAFPKPVHTGHASIDARLEKLTDLLHNIRKYLVVSSDANAFREALDFPFRADAARAIVAFRGDSIEDDEGPIKSFGVAIHHSFAESAGVSLHLIGPVDELKGSPDAKGTPVAFNAKQFLTLDAVKKNKQVVGVPYSKTNAISYIKDLGIDTTIESGGYVFDLNSYQAAKTSADKKKFVGVVAGALAEHLARTEVTSDCECNITNGLYATDSCDSSQTKWRAPTVSV